MRADATMNGADQLLELSANQTIDYQLFRAKYVNLRNQYSDTFQKKVFAENVVYKGKKMKLTDESTYEMVHSNLTALELSADVETTGITGG